jgi:hypothetical protein
MARRSYPTQEELKKVLHYSPESGQFTWIDCKAYGVKNGDVAGWESLGYCFIKVKGVDCQVHNLAWVYVHGRLPDGELDHINGDGTDNRLSNLREVSRFNNMKNRKVNCNNTSGCKGVTWHTNIKKWQARITSNGVRYHLGYFDSVDDAGNAYDKAAVELHREFRRAA